MSVNSSEGSQLDLLTPPRFDSICSSNDFGGSPLMFHFPYQISSTISSIPKLIDRLVFSILNFQTDVGEIFSLIFESDPDCFAGVLIQTAAELIESFVDVDIDRCHRIADMLGDKITDWEARWYNAVYSFKLYSPRQACHILMDLLVQYPFDLLAVFIGTFWAFYSVDKFLMRDTIGRVLAFHGDFHPYRNLLDSFYGFALLETNSLEKGAKLVEDAFDNDPDNPWIIHVKCHALMYGEKFDEALQLMLDKKQSYKNSSLGYHNAWHAADLLIEKQSYEEANQIFRDDLLDQITSASRMSDACALLWKLRMFNQKVENSSFTKILIRMNDKITDHSSAYFATHFAAALLGAEDFTGYHTFRHSLDVFLAKFKDNSIVNNYKTVGLKVMDAFTSFAMEDYETSASISYGFRDRLLEIGGSEAQKEFYLNLIYQSLHKMGKYDADVRLLCLINERACHREITPSLKEIKSAIENNTTYQF